MDFPEAMAQYWKLRAQHEAGALSDEEFEVAVGDLSVVDAQGDAWQIGVTTGRWYRYDGHTWVEDFPTLATEGAGERAPSPPSASRRAAWAPRAARAAPPPGWQEEPPARPARGGVTPRAPRPLESRLPIPWILIAVLVACFLLAALLAVVLLANPDLLSG